MGESSEIWQNEYNRPLDLDMTIFADPGADYIHSVKISLLAKIYHVIQIKFN